MKAALLLSTALVSALACMRPAMTAELPQAAMLDRAMEWEIRPRAASWTALVKAPDGMRQEARWYYALSLIGVKFGAEAIGMLDIMLAHDRGLDGVPNYRLARGIALIHMNHPAEALRALDMPSLALNAEACAWRLVGYARTGASDQALAQASCALPAIQALPKDDRKPFILALASAAIDAGKIYFAQDWLRLLKDDDVEASLLRARALLAAGRASEVNARLAPILRNGTPVQKAEARLLTISAGVKVGTLSSANALKQLHTLEYGWRGGPVERQTLRLTYSLSAAAGDLDGALRAGANLVRYSDLSHIDTAFVLELRAKLASVLDPANGLPIDRAAGLYWNYRDLAPTGAEGDLLVGRLGVRLEEAGLYDRAAELFEHQLMERTQDIAQGPLSVKVATLFVRAGYPERAVKAIRGTDKPNYPTDMVHDRKRMEAVALAKLGKGDEAVAVLDGVPDSAALIGEILWKQRNWQALVNAFQPVEGKTPKLDAGQQTAVLRQAIALSMLGRKDDIASLRTRYAAGFKDQPTASAFELLTASADLAKPSQISEALAAMPSASPAGALADLL